MDFEALDEIRTVIARAPREAPANVVALLHKMLLRNGSLALCRPKGVPAPFQNTNIRS